MSSSTRLSITIATLVMFSLYASPAFALLEGTTYDIKAPTVGSGGSTSSSSNFSVLNTSGQQDNAVLSGSTYQIQSGYVGAVQANVPGKPTLSNPNGSATSLQLDLDTQNNPTDTKFAIAISSDNFTTTKYVSKNHTPTSTLTIDDYMTNATWQAGESLIEGLESSTTYKVKVKAMQGGFTETRFGPVSAGVATAAGGFVFRVTGTAKGTLIDGKTTNRDTSATAIDFDAISRNVQYLAAQKIFIQTPVGETTGYVVTVRATKTFTDGKNTIRTIGATDGNTTPVLTPTSIERWPTTIAHSAFGFRTTDTNLGDSAADRFSEANIFAPLDSTARRVAQSSTAVPNGEQFYVTFGLQAGTEIPSGDYTTEIVYSATTNL